MKWYFTPAIVALLLSGCNQNDGSYQNPNESNNSQNEIHWEGPEEQMFWRGSGWYNGTHIKNEADFNRWRNSRLRQHSQ